jgi:hypothetical protein
MLWRLVTNWSGKWPAPYWFAVGLGVLLAYGLLVRGLKHLVWVIPLGGFAALVSWFSSFGFYQVSRKAWFARWWSRLDDWEQSLPTLILMILFVVFLLFLRAADKGWRIHLSVSAFVLAFFITSMFADLVCAIYLPPDGTFGAFDHDVFGFRRGAYYLFMVAASVSFLKIVSTKMGVISPSQPMQPTRR